MHPYFEVYYFDSKSLNLVETHSELKDKTVFVCFFNVMSKSFLTPRHDKFKKLTKKSKNISLVRVANFKNKNLSRRRFVFKIVSINFFEFAGNVILHKFKSDRK